MNEALNQSSSLKMTLLIAELLDLDLVNYHLDGFVMPIKDYASIDKRCFDLTEVRIICDYCNQNNILKIAKMDKIIFEDEVNDLYNTLDKLIDLGIDYFMYTDTSVLAYFKGKKLEHKLIYCASKMVASLNEASYYNDLGVIVNPSTEISLDELAEICKLDNICLTVYGYLDIFYSKRKLISLYKEHIGSSSKLKKEYKIKEETRNEENIILENENGTFIFSDFIYMVYRELSNLKPKFMKINSFNLNKNDLFKIIDIYEDAIENGPTIDNYDQLLDINGNIGEGFLYKKANILDE